MPRLSPYNPEAEPRAESWYMGLGWGNGSSVLKTQCREAGEQLWGEYLKEPVVACLGKWKEKKRRGTETKGRRGWQRLSTAVTSSTKSTSCPLCTASLVVTAPKHKPKSWKGGQEAVGSSNHGMVLLKDGSHPLVSSLRILAICVPQLPLQLKELLSSIQLPAPLLHHCPTPPKCNASHHSTHCHHVPNPAQAAGTAPSCSKIPALTIPQHKLQL